MTAKEAIAVHQARIADLVTEESASEGRRRTLLRELSTSKTAADRVRLTAHLDAVDEQLDAARSEPALTREQVERARMQAEIDSLTVSLAELEA